jgi:hypothetical protein
MDSFNKLYFEEKGQFHMLDKTCNWFILSLREIAILLLHRNDNF